MLGLFPQRRIGFGCRRASRPDICGTNLEARTVAIGRIAVVQYYAFHVVLALCLVSGTWCASHPALHSSALAAVDEATPVATAVEADVMDLRTGDTFWGLHVDGVVPCSSMLVKGGGHLVALSVQHDHGVHCIYQVAREKRITLHGHAFLLRVVAADQIHVEREPVSDVVATNP
jgi:hypothetical protein